MTPLTWSIRCLAFPLGFLLLATVGRGDSPPADQAEIVHVLNRITFGPRPGDIEMVKKMGLQNYIKEQLHPETIDDSATDQAVAQFEELGMSGPELNKFFFADLKKIIQFQKQSQSGGQPGQGQTPRYGAAAGGNASMQDNSSMQGAAPGTNPTAGNAPTQGQGPGEGRALGMGTGVNSVTAIAQLEHAKLVRAVDSKRQLQEVLVDFWNNHFNIDVKKGPCRIYAILSDRDTIRPHIWGSFRDLVEASAKSAAMLQYLDNATNSVERTLSPMEQEMRATYIRNAIGFNPAGAPGPIDTLKPKQQGGINENYARELMELHTIGVDGGYTQKDVQEVARCFTGWTINRQTGDFRFSARDHDDGAKMVLGHAIPAGGGMQDGETVIDLLCSSPACAHFISKEMCERFVSDDPPAALVDRIAGVFTQTKGDLRSMTEAILSSPEFLAPASYGNKIKSPFEFAVSAVRASGSTITPRDPFARFRDMGESSAILGRSKATEMLTDSKRQSLNWHIYEMGEPLFACTPPTGYTEVSRKWVSPGALIERLNFAMALTQQEVADVEFDAQNILGGIDLDKPDAVLDQCITTLEPNNVSDSTRKLLTENTLADSGNGQTVNASKLIALILGSPEFQRK